MSVRAWTRWVGVVLGLAISILVVWLISLNRPRFFFCAAAVALLLILAPFVRSRRHWLYAIGTLICLGTLILALWPTDPEYSWGRCGSVLNPHDGNHVRMIAAEDGFDPDWYLDICDDRRDRNVRLVSAGVLVTLVFVGGAVLPLGASHSDVHGRSRSLQTPSL